MCLYKNLFNAANFHVLHSLLVNVPFHFSVLRENYIESQEEYKKNGSLLCAQQLLSFVYEGFSPQLTCSIVFIHYE